MNITTRQNNHHEVARPEQSQGHGARLVRHAHARRVRFSEDIVERPAGPCAPPSAWYTPDDYERWRTQVRAESEGQSVHLARRVHVTMVLEQQRCPAETIPSPLSREAWLQQVSELMTAEDRNRAVSTAQAHHRSVSGEEIPLDR